MCRLILIIVKSSGCGDETRQHLLQHYFEEVLGCEYEVAG